jgi:hypothetical protein
LRAGFGLFVLDRDVSRRFDHLFEDSAKVFQPGGRDDDIVPAAIDIFSDSEKAAARIFLQSENEGLALNLNLLGP